MKVKNKLIKDWTITIEEMQERRTEKGMTENKTLYYLVNAKTPSGRGIGFRADTPLKVWSNLMDEIYL